MTTDDDVAPVTTADLCRLAGITYRQLDYWTRAGYCTPAYAVTNGTSLTSEQRAQLPDRWRPPIDPGTGAVRYFHPAEADVVKRIALLLRVGMTLDCSARIARSWAEHPAWPIYLGEGVTLHIDDWHPEHPQHADYIAAYRAEHSPERTR